MKQYALLFTGLAVLCSCLLTSCDNKLPPPARTGYGLKSENGMVVSAHPEASLVGVEILRKGGNAIDASVATGFALAVCYPNAGNIGGGGLMVLRLDNGTVDALDYRERAPMEAAGDMYLDENGEVIEGASTSTHLASGVPGSVDGLYRAHSKYGQLSFAEVIQPAIDMAGNGFVLTAKQARELNSIQKTLNERNDHSTAFHNSEKWVEGDTLRQAELAQTLTRIRDQGPDGFYKGETANLIVKEMEKAGGLITAGDLADYKAIWREPLRSDYKNYGLIAMPPVSSGGVATIQLMTMVENYPLKEWGFHSPEAIHLMVEAERRVYADRAEYLGDPDYFKVPVKELTDKDYLAGRMSDFDPDRSSLSSEISAGTLPLAESEETTHYSVTDSYGNAVSVTTTLNGGYGNCIVVEGAGFFLNNEMDDFSIKPGFPNIYGLVGGKANSIEPGKRMLSSMTPTIVEKDGELYMVVGSPGGSTIITSVFQVILNVIEFDMDMQEAVDRSRFHHQWLPDYISYEENGFSEQILEKLKSKGHTLKERGTIGRVDAIRITEDRLFEGGADKRGDDMAAGY